MKASIAALLALTILLMPLIALASPMPDATGAPQQEQSRTPEFSFYVPAIFMVIIGAYFVITNNKKAKENQRRRKEQQGE